MFCIHISLGEPNPIIFIKGECHYVLNLYLDRPKRLLKTVQFHEYRFQSSKSGDLSQWHAIFSRVFKFIFHFFQNCFLHMHTFLELYPLTTQTHSTPSPHIANNYTYTSCIRIVYNNVGTLCPFCQRLCLFWCAYSHRLCRHHIRKVNDFVDTQTLQIS